MPHLVAHGTAVPERFYSQEEVARLLGVDHPVVVRMFQASHIRQRHLFLPEPEPHTGQLPSESFGDLHDRFRKGATLLGRQAIEACLDAAGVAPTEVGAIVCVTSTGFMVPGLSVLYIRELGLDRACHRTDIVGMGCNAGLNGLGVAANWVRANPGRHALLVCCEINSAIYCQDGSIRTGIVNSLFGDGAAAMLLGPERGRARGPAIVDQESQIIVEEEGAMRFDWNPERGRWSFYLSKEIPHVIASYARAPVQRLLARNGLHRGDVAHWITHTGGGAVIDGLMASLELSERDVRHARIVLERYGNLSSASFLFSYAHLSAEEITAPGEFGVMITMGPGAQIETALLRW